MLYSLVTVYTRLEHIVHIVTASFTGGLDLFVVPGLAFTRSGHRLGRGGGYYDRYIQWYTGQCHLGTFQRAKLVAFAFEEQIIDHIPSETHDLIIDQLFVA